MSDTEKNVMLLLSCEAHVQNLKRLVEKDNSWFSFLQCFKEDNTNKMKLRLENLRLTVRYMTNVEIKNNILSYTNEIGRKVNEGIEENREAIEKLSDKLLTYIVENTNRMKRNPADALDKNIFYNKNKFKL